MRTEGLNSQRDKFRARIAALELEDDPLAVYVEFVQWTIDNYGDDPNSGLSQLLEDATQKYKGDPSYKSDLRYLKLWTLHARKTDRAAAVKMYSQLWKSGVGVSYSLLYEEYAAALEAVGRNADAEVIYRRGLKHQARPAERLKARYAEFQKRAGPSVSKPASDPSGSSKAKTAASSSSPVHHTTAASRYAVMLTPSAPGKRPEKYQFDMSLLYTEENGEFCIEEARTRSMGLLRKKWPVLPVEPLKPPSSVRFSTVPLKDDDTPKARPSKRKSMLAGEPTVTINTRQALDDVFGMFNSPDRTTRMGVGGKHAPFKAVDVAQPKPSPPAVFQQTPVNASAAAFRPFVDGESSSAQKKEKKPLFTPFVDSNPNKPPARAAFAPKESSISPSTSNDENSVRNPKKATKLTEKPLAESVFSKHVFIPENKTPLAPLRDAFTEDHGQPRPKTLTHERAKSYHDISDASSNDSIRSTPFKPFVDESNKTPFKVFTRPDESENVFTPKLPGSKPSIPLIEGSAFTPFKDKPVLPETVPPHDDPPEAQLEPTEDYDQSADYDEDGAAQEPEHEQEQAQNGVHDLEQYPEDENDYSDDFIDEEGQGDFEAPLHDDIAETDERYGQEVSYRDVPFGGRFGEFNVMTPISERTCEYTTTSHSAYNTPSSLLNHIPEDEANEEDQEAAQLLPDGADELTDEDGNEDEDGVQPFRLPPKDESSVVTLSQSTSKLSLADTLTLSSNFRPPNPCNPFDTPILQSLLSRLSPDSQCYDLSAAVYNGLDGLQKFAKKIRKTSGSSSSGNMDDVYPLTLEGQRFVVKEKLGEGGFGAVFKARDLGAALGDDDDDSDLDLDDDEEEGSSMVALKVVKPRNLWEYYVLRRLHSALPPTNRRSIVFPHALYAFRDESYLVLDYCPQGTLLDIVNRAESAGVSQQGACLDELLVMFFTVELLRLLESMHNIGFIHGDLKIDNCLLRLEDFPGSSSAWYSKYQSSGEGGWTYKGLKVIDFGRTIDTRLFHADQQYIADWPTDERDCIEIQQGKPWTFQTDYFGLATIVYCMFFGKYISASSLGSSASASGETRLKLTTPLKRYWQTELWGRLFDVLLNPTLVKPDGRMPLCDELGKIRRDMEAWLEANCNRAGGTLKGLLKKVEMSCLN